MEHGWEKVSNWECLFVHRQKGLFISVYVDDKKNWQERNRTSTQCGKHSDLKEPTSFLDHVYLGCTQRQCEISKDIVDNYRTMFESKISAGATEKLPHSEKLGANISSWSHDLEGHAKKCVGCIANWRTKQLSSETKSQHHALSTTNSRKKKWDLSENCQMFAYKLF